MTREIKFKAWHTKAKMMSPIKGFNNMDSDKNDKFNYCVCKEDCGRPHEGNCWRMKNIILLQYTGLKDKNGKEIYEGDVVHGKHATKTHLRAWGAPDKYLDKHYEDNEIYIIKFIEGKYHLQKPEYKKEEKGWIINWHISSEVKDLEVIGNIYENSNLLK